MVGGLEYYYGGGVNQARPGSTPFGQPLQVIDLGYEPAYSLPGFMWLQATNTHAVCNLLWRWYLDRLAALQGHPNPKGHQR